MTDQYRLLTISRVLKFWCLNVKLNNFKKTSRQAFIQLFSVCIYCMYGIYIQINTSVTMYPSIVNANWESVVV